MHFVYQQIKYFFLNDVLNKGPYCGKSHLDAKDIVVLLHFSAYVFITP